MRVTSGKKPSRTTTLPLTTAINNSQLVARNPQLATRFVRYLGQNK
ncbi:hypothetical protein PLANPX_1802 [Lacipirellula parvula]|uniref:Uncharacterized protein n=1 Tax=Lacipirellula parvula TaxID=2650471 RepID=A0A5K7X6I8_9BACT|nr:hypothetical protein PLANPX_1802 [Lacipirellula parvula]